MRQLAPRGMILLTLLAVVSSPALAHRGAAPEPAEKPIFELKKLTSSVYYLSGRGGNVAFLVTEPGVLVVDDQYENIAQGIVDQIRTVTDRPIRYLVNTHYHSDHTGGNPVFIKLAEIIAHDSVRPRLLEYPETVRKIFPARLKALESEIAAIADAADPYRAALEKDMGLVKYFIESAVAFKPETAAPPGITYEGHVRVWLGDQEVYVFHLGPGHTDGDSLVYFRNEKVLHMGDLLFQGSYPFIDTEAGGSVSGYVDNLDQAIALVPPETQVIPGHGPVTDVDGLRRMRDFLSRLLAQVDKTVQAGMSRGDAVRAIKIDGFPDIKPGFRTLGNLVSAAYDELKAKR